LAVPGFEVGAEVALLDEKGRAIALRRISRITARRIDVEDRCAHFDPVSGQLLEAGARTPRCRIVPSTPALREDAERESLISRIHRQRWRDVPIEVLRSVAGDGV
jgi:hypothetical protein